MQDTIRTRGALGSPTVRLALTTAAMSSELESARARYGGALMEQSPTIRLAHVPGAQGDNSLLGQRDVEQVPMDSAPALLVSYFYIDGFLKRRSDYRYRDWALDSGAFSAHASGKAIDLDRYIEAVKELRATDPTLSDVFSLDVIGDWRASLRNTERMWAAGVEAIPAYHIGEPEDALLAMARDYPKIALGGVARVRQKARLAWAHQCFSRVWPKKIHGFGIATEREVLGLPWHSVDSTSWEMGPCGFGQWKTYGKMNVRGSRQNLRSEIEWYLALERRARDTWRQQMALLEEGDRSA